LTKLGFCKICNFFEKQKWKEEKLKEKISEGISLRKLKIFCEGLGLEADTKTLSTHIKDHLGIELKKESLIVKTKEFFSRPSKVEIPKCEHLNRTFHFNEYSELVEVFCLDCREKLGEFNPQEERKTLEKDRVLLGSLRKR